MANSATPAVNSTDELAQLVWMKSKIWHIANSRFGQYTIEDRGEKTAEGRYKAIFTGDNTEIHTSLEEAKAAAQADYDRRRMENA